MQRSPGFSLCQDSLVIAFLRALAHVFQVLSQLNGCHEVVFVLYWIMTGYVTAKVNKHEEHPQTLCVESLPVITVPRQISPRDATSVHEVNFLEQTCPTLSNTPANPPIFVFPSAYCVWDYLDLLHSDKAVTSRAANIADSETNMRCVLHECCKEWSDQQGQCYKAEMYETEMSLANHQSCLFTVLGIQRTSWGRPRHLSCSRYWLAYKSGVVGYLSGLAVEELTTRFHGFHRIAE